jgi:hypothetical protein
MTFTLGPCPRPGCTKQHGVTTDRLPGPARTRTPRPARGTEAPVASTGSDPAVPHGAAVSDEAAPSLWRLDQAGHKASVGG